MKRQVEPIDLTGQPRSLKLRYAQPVSTRKKPPANSGRRTMPDLRLIVTFACVLIFITACGSASGPTGRELEIVGTVRSTPIGGTCYWEGIEYESFCRDSVNYSVSITNKTSDLVRPWPDFVTPTQMTEHNPEYRLSRMHQFGSCYPSDSIRPGETMTCTASYSFERYSHTFNGERVFIRSAIPLAAVRTFAFEVVVFDSHLGLEVRKEVQIE